MTTQGYGIFPFGTGAPFGYFTNASVPSIIERPHSLIEHFDFATNDYVLDESGNPKATTSVRHKVEMIIALSASGSISNPELGMALQQLGKVDSSYDQRVSQIINNAFSDLINTRQIELIKSDVLTIGTVAILEIEYIDLTTNTKEFVRGKINV